MKPILFFADSIVIVPHTATHSHHLDKPQMLRKFIGAQTSTLHDVGAGELQCTLTDGTFITGPELDDKTLSANELEELFGGPSCWGHHPGWLRSEWKAEVANDDTICSYWDWVYNKIQNEEPA